MMLALLLYSYSHGIFSSRRIERATFKDISIRFLCGNQHPDHDTICTFRRNNERAISSAFLHILKLAQELGILKLGTVSTDGTKIKANASIHKSLRNDRAQQLEQELELEIAELMEKAEKADNDDEDDKNDQLKGDLARLKTLKEKMKVAQKKLEEQERTKCSDQINLTDGDSRIMRKNSRSEYSQSYNCQATVDAEGSMMVVGARVTNAGVDRQELLGNVESIPEELGAPENILADNGYVSEDQVKKVEEKGVKVFLPVSCDGEFSERKFDFRPRREQKKTKKHLPWIDEMSEQMKKESSRLLYRLRKQTVEPVFGIIKETLGFRQFHLRGLDKVNNEWTLLMSAYNVKRLAKLIQ